MKIGIDIDEVLSCFVDGINDFHNRVYGTNLKFEDHISWDLEKVFGGSKERAVKVVHDFYDTGGYRNLMVKKGAQEAVNALSKNHMLVALTSRPEFMKGTTLDWLNKNFNKDINETIFGNQYSSPSESVDKSVLCLKFGINVLLDDHPNSSLKCAEKGIKVFLFDRPWNKGIEHENLIRVKDWPEIIGKLK